MDFQNQMPQEPVFVRSVAPKENNMATAAMTLGIIGGLSTFLLPFYLPCIFGGISMVLAFLSKGSSPSWLRSQAALCVRRSVLHPRRTVPLRTAFPASRGR